LKFLPNFIIQWLKRYRFFKEDLGQLNVFVFSYVQEAVKCSRMPSPPKGHLKLLRKIFGLLLATYTLFSRNFLSNYAES